MREIWGPAMPRVTIGDVGDENALGGLCEGAGALIHGAGLIKARSRAEFFAVNRDGTGRAARAVGDGRMILVSSLAAREPALSDYAASKRAGEAAAAEALGDRLVVLRPPAIYGPGDRETLALFRLAATAPVLPVPDAPDARLALAHVDDAVANLIAALEQGWPAGVYAMGGARPAGYGWREIFAAAAAAMGRSPPVAPLPTWVLGAAAALSQAVAQLRGSAVIFTPGKAREILHGDWSVAEAEMTPAPRPPARSLEVGFADTVAWYRAQGWLS
jgi:nucleoside-diphosphate-sugar epimerase